MVGRPHANRALSPASPALVRGSTRIECMMHDVLMFRVVSSDRLSLGLGVTGCHLLGAWRGALSLCNLAGASPPSDVRRCLTQRILIEGKTPLSVYYLEGTLAKP